MVSGVNEHCQCSLLKESHISSEEFVCMQNNPSVVLFRGMLTGSDLNDCDDILSLIENWVLDGLASVVAQSNRLSIDTNCMVEIESLHSSPDCTIGSEPPSSDSGGQRSDSMVAVIAAPVAVGVLLFIGILAIICYICCKRKRTKTLVIKALPESYFHSHTCISPRIIEVKIAFACVYTLIGKYMLAIQCRLT